MSRQMQIFISFISAMLLISKCWLVGYRIFHLNWLVAGLLLSQIYNFRNLVRRRVVVLGGNLLKAIKYL